MTADRFLVVVGLLVGVLWGWLILQATLVDRRLQRWTLYAVALFSIVILRVPVLLGGRSALLPIIAALFVTCSLLAPIPLPRGWRPLVVLAYVGLLAVSLVRGGLSGAYGSVMYTVTEAAVYASLLLFGYAFIVGATGDRERRLAILALAPATYVGVNLVLYPLWPAREIDSSLSGAAGSSASILASLGVTAERVVFPMATSVNLFSVLCAGGLAAAIVLATRSWALPRWIPLLGAVACTVALLLEDSRGPLLIALGVTLFFALQRRARGSALFAYIIPALPILLIVGLRFLSNSTFAQNLSRNGDDFATATGRFEIWEGAWRVLSQFPPASVFGWGAFGHVTSGASLNWYMNFRGVQKDPITVQTHSLILQTVFDMGWIGLIALVAAAAVTLTTLARAAMPTATALIAGMAAILLCGVTEVAGTYMSQEALASILLIMGAALALDSGSSPVESIPSGSRRTTRRDTVRGQRRPSPTRPHASTPRTRVRG